jgi:hypothetical protein
MPPEGTVADRAQLVLDRLDQLAARTLVDLAAHVEEAMLAGDDDLAALERVTDDLADLQVERDLEGRHWPT